MKIDDVNIRRDSCKVSVIFVWF